MCEIYIPTKSTFYLQTLHGVSRIFVRVKSDFDLLRTEQFFRCQSEVFRKSGNIYPPPEAFAKQVIRVEGRDDTLRIGYEAFSHEVVDHRSERHLRQRARLDTLVESIAVEKPVVISNQCDMIRRAFVAMLSISQASFSSSIV